VELLAKSVDAERAKDAALELFDRLRLRQALAAAFNAQGIEGEDGWRAAARVRVQLLAQAAAGRAASAAAMVAEPVKEKPIAKAPDAAKAKKTADVAEAAKKEVGLDAALWADADVRWLCGVHGAEGHEYLVREPYEELLWWLELPRLMRVADEAAPTMAERKALMEDVRAGLAAAEAAGYRVDGMAGTGEMVATAEVVEAEDAVPAEPRRRG
jgi:hypothetical protein